MDLKFKNTWFVESVSNFSVIEGRRMYEFLQLMSNESLIDVCNINQFANCMLVPTLDVRELVVGFNTFMSVCNCKCGGNVVSLKSYQVKDVEEKTLNALFYQSTCHMIVDTEELESKSGYMQLLDAVRSMSSTDRGD